MVREIPPNNVPLKDLWCSHLGERFAIVGNGPSAGKVTYDEVSEHNDVVIGVNRMWAWDVPDYYMFVGRDIVETFTSVLRKRPSHELLQAHWIMPSYRPLPPHPARKLTQFSAIRGGQRRITPEMVTREWVTANEALVIHRTIVLTACHMALIMGARSIELFGCEGVTKIGEEPRFTPTGPAVAGQVKKYGQIQEALDGFWEDWSGKVQLWNSSEGYEGIWEAGR